jgi:hypothetical protein
MKSPSLFLRVLGALACAAALFAPSAARAQSFFNITLNTSALIGHPAGPFYLDFQLNDGSGIGNANNTAILSQFNFGGGSAIVGSDFAFGGVTGNLSSTVKLTDSTPFNEFFQAFNAGSFLSFSLSLTKTVNAPTPDLFSFAILDSNLFNLPTFAPGSDALITIDITGANPSIATYAGNFSIAPSAGGAPIGLAAPTIVAVPEPSTYGLLGALSLVGAVAWSRRRRAAGRTA